MTDWSDKAIRKTRQKMEDRNQAGAIFLEQQRIRNARAVPLWDEVRTSMRTHIADFNQSMLNALVIQIDMPNDMVVRNELGGGKLLEITFDPKIGRISWSSLGVKKEGCEVAVTDDGKAQFQWGKIPATPDSIATQMLDSLLDI